MNCPLCKSSELSLMASRKNFPVLQNVLCDTPEKSEKIPRGDISLYMCKTCEFVFNATYKQVNYDKNYENYQGCSSLFGDYLKNNAKKVADYIIGQKQPVLLLEIGCGQGNFLTEVMSYIPDDLKVSAIGYDPACKAENNSRLQFVTKYFDEEAAKFVSSLKEFPIKVCLSRHVIEHIQDPNLILKSCSLLDAGTHIFLETPNVDWILKHNAFEDIVYEHCSFYSPKSIQYLLQKYGFSLVEFSSVFGGQYMWIEAEKEETVENRCFSYRKGEETLFNKWIKSTSSVGGGGGIEFIVWGAGAKCVAFLQAIDPNKKYISKVIDINPRKQGMFLSGSGHKIVPPEYLKTVKKSKVLIIMNENYLNEIKECVANMGIVDVSYTTLHD